MINNIPTYLISCDEFPERKKQAFEHLKSNGVDFKYWRGLHGKSSGISTQFPHGYHENGSPLYSGIGNLALLINHLFLYQHCLSNDYEKVVILEDDCNLQPDWRDRMTKMLSVLPPDFDIVYLGWLYDGHQRSYSHVIDCLYNNIDNCIFGTHALLLSKNGLKILAQNTRVLKHPIDIDIYLNSIPSMKYYICYPSIITQKSVHDKSDPIWNTTTI